MQEAADYQAMLAERLSRASMNGKEFKSMMIRAERCHEKNQSKYEAKRSAEEAKLNAEVSLSITLKGQSALYWWCLVSCGVVH